MVSEDGDRGPSIDPCAAAKVGGDGGELAVGPKRLIDLHLMRHYRSYAALPDVPVHLRESRGPVILSASVTPSEGRAG